MGQLPLPHQISVTGCRTVLPEIDRRKLRDRFVSMDKHRFVVFVCRDQDLSALADIVVDGYQQPVVVDWLEPGEYFEGQPKRSDEQFMHSRIEHLNGMRRSAFKNEMMEC